MHAVKHAINNQLLEKIDIIEEQDKVDFITYENPKKESKKNQANSKEELTDYQKRLREFIIKVQSLYKKGYSKSQVVKMLKTTYKRIRKYLDGNPNILCRSDGRNTCSRSSLVDSYKIRINLSSLSIFLTTDYFIGILTGHSISNSL